MARPRNPAGSHGVINVVEIEPGRWRARTLYRFHDGKRRQVERVRVGKTGAKAEQALKLALTTIEAPSLEEIKRSTAIKQLAEIYLANKVDAGLKPRSIDTYRHAITSLIVPAIGNLTVGEMSPMRVQKFISSVTKSNGAGAAKGCRSALSGMLALAVVNDAIASNPVAGIENIRRPDTSSAATALPLDEVPAFLEKIRGDKEMQRLDLIDLWEFMLATGCRIGEALGLVWDRVDLDAGTVTIGPNVVRIRGVGLTIQSEGKTAAARRTIIVPSATVELLRRRVESVPATDLGLVFPSMLGKLRDTSNTEADWRVNRDRLGYPGFKSHGFRKTVATALSAAGMPLNEIAEYLGHEDPTVTTNTYMSRTTKTRKAADALGSMFGVSSE